MVHTIMEKENGMKKALMLLAGAAFAASAAHAGTYSILQESDCPLINAGELTKVIQKAGVATGLDLPKDMALRAELRCTVNGKAAPGARYVYTFRAAIEKQLNDGEQMRWAPVAQLTGFGTTTGSTLLLREVGFTVRDLIRQEP
jgi:hypothetical protein